MYCTFLYVQDKNLDYFRLTAGSKMMLSSVIRIVCLQQAITQDNVILETATG